MLISIEGNIGTGKTYMLDNLRIYISKILNNPQNIRDLQNKKILEDKGVVSINDIAFLPELVDEWVQLKDNNNKNILECYYNNKKRWGYTFQMNVIVSRIKNIVKNGDKKIIFIERSLFTDKNIFSKLLYDNGDLNDLEWKLYNETYTILKNFYKTTDYYIYLKCSPEISLHRINKRSRKGEHNISLKYIKNLDTRHNDLLLKNNKTIIINANNDITDKNYSLDILNTIFKGIV